MRRHGNRGSKTLRYPLEKLNDLQSIGKGHPSPSDETLMDILQSNVQRLPVNDNVSLPPRISSPVGWVGLSLSYIGFACLMIAAAPLLAIYKLVDASEDSDY